MVQQLHGHGARDGQHDLAELGGELVELTVIFRNMLPSEELVSFIKRTLRQRDGSGGPGVQVSIEKGKEALPSYHVGLSTPLFAEESIVCDQDPYLAVRSAFAKLYDRAPSFNVAS